MDINYKPPDLKMRKVSQSLPGRQQQVSGLVGPIPLVKQFRYRWGPALGQPGGCRYRRFLIQVSEYLVNHRRVFNAGDQLDETGAFATNISLREGLLLAVCCYWQY